MQNNTTIGVIDLFCGIGGLSYGMYKNGFDIIAGFDIDGTCKYAYEANNKALFYNQDIKSVTKEQISALFEGYKIKVLAGCAPCQPFSSYAFKNKKKDPNKYDLLYEFGRLIEEVLPDIVTMENVSQILSFKQKPVFSDFLELLKKHDYEIDYKIIFCPDYGIPQTRKRLVLLASRLGKINIISPTHKKENYKTVREVIGNLPPIKAGETCPSDFLHKAKALSALNLQRIRSTPMNGGWGDWDESLLLECHKRQSGKSFGSVYGRMNWDAPAPTMTTLCTGLGNGRFGHPEQDRAISIREAAMFQTFPNDYKFFSPKEEVSMTKVSRYIGNAVPPKLGEVTAKSIKIHVEQINEQLKNNTL